MADEMEYMEQAKELADSYRLLVHRRDMLRQQYEDSRSWFYTKERSSTSCRRAHMRNPNGCRQADCRTRWNARSLIAIRCWHP